MGMWWRWWGEGDEVIIAVVFRCKSRDCFQLIIAGFLLAIIGKFILIAKELVTGLVNDRLFIFSMIGDHILGVKIFSWV